MTVEQYDSIYNEAPEWMQIAMQIALYTSQRPHDIRNLKWSDIDGDILTIRPHKTEAIHARGKSEYVKHFTFNLKSDANKNLNAAINRAKIFHKKLSLMRSAFRDCPYIIARQPEIVFAGSKTLLHPCYITKHQFAKLFQSVRDKVHSNSKVFWHNNIEPTSDQLPSWYGIRKLSLQLIAEQHGENAAQQRGGHTDIKTTQQFYLAKMDSVPVDCELEVTL
jgi:integrase